MTRSMIFCSKLPTSRYKTEFPWTRRAEEKVGKEGNGYVAWILEKAGLCLCSIVQRK